MFELWSHNQAHRPAAGKAPGLQSAFSLMELLVVIAIMGLVVVVVLSTLRGGMRLYQRLKADSNQQLEVLLAMEAMEKRIRNACPFAIIGFNGDEYHLSFPFLLTIPGQTNAPEAVLCRAVYEYDSNSKSLTVTTTRILPGNNDLRRNSVSVPHELARLDELKFSYCYWNAKTQVYQWKNAWLAREGMPLGVKLLISLRTGGRKTSLERTVWIPVAH